MDHHEVLNCDCQLIGEDHHGVGEVDAVSPKIQILRQVGSGTAERLSISGRPGADEAVVEGEGLISGSEIVRGASQDVAQEPGA